MVSFTCYFVNDTTFSCVFIYSCICWFILKIGFWGLKMKFPLVGMGGFCFSTWCFGDNLFLVYLREIRGFSLCCLSVYDGFTVATVNSL